MNTFTLTELSVVLVNTLINEGWEFSLHYGNHHSYCKDIEDDSWEADFSKRKENGLWDNHESGYSLDVNVAIENAYNNIRNGIKLRKNGREN